MDSVPGGMLGLTCDLSVLVGGGVYMLDWPIRGCIQTFRAENADKPNHSFTHLTNQKVECCCISSNMELAQKFPWSEEMSVQYKGWMHTYDIQYLFNSHFRVYWVAKISCNKVEYKLVTCRNRGSKMGRCLLQGPVLVQFQHLMACLQGCM